MSTHEKVQDYINEFNELVSNQKKLGYQRCVYPESMKARFGKYFANNSHAMQVFVRAVKYNTGCLKHWVEKYQVMNSDEIVPKKQNKIKTEKIKSEPNFVFVDKSYVQQLEDQIAELQKKLKLAKLAEELGLDITDL